jgi:SAM-dependent methyltransferase
MKIVFPSEADYPEEIFRVDLPPELRVGCARAYFKVNALARRIFRRRVHMAFDLMPERQWQRVLDAGTGAGFLLPALSADAQQVLGVDISRVLRFAKAMQDKRCILNVHLCFADLLHLPFSSNGFDLIMCLSVIEHIPDPTLALIEMDRVLRKDGILIIGYPLEHVLFRFFKSLGSLYDSLRFRAKPRKMPAEEWFHPHVCNYRHIQRMCGNIFVVDACQDVGVFGVPLYRLLRLVKRQSTAD